MVFGTFDRLHPGHIFFLREAKKLGDYLVVVVARDVTVKQVKGHLPRQSEEDRAAHLRNAGIPDEVLLGSLTDKYALVRQERPQVIALGYDQEAFVAGLLTILPDNFPVVRLPAFEPEKFKSSRLPS